MNSTNCVTEWHLRLKTWWFHISSWERKLFGGCHGISPPRFRFFASLVWICSHMLGLVKNVWSKIFIKISNSKEILLFYRTLESLLLFLTWDKITYAARSMEPTFTRTGFLRYLSAILCTPGGHVAEVMIVWRSGRMSRRIFLISGSKPWEGETKFQHSK